MTSPWRSSDGQNRSESNVYVAEFEIDGQKRTVKAGDDGCAFYFTGISKAEYVKRGVGAYEAV